MNGATRGETPPSISDSAAAKDSRSSVSVSPPSSAASNSPSGFSARRIWISAPGRSFANCSASAETTRSSEPSRSGSVSSSATTSASGDDATRYRCPIDVMPSTAVRAASAGVPRSTAVSNSRSTAPRRSARSDATRSIRNVSKPSARARAWRRRNSARSKTRGLCAMLSTVLAAANVPARAAVRYDDVAAKLVHAIKYGNRLDLAPLLGGWMVRAGKELFEGADALVPVPLHWRRLWARRFNQSAALAQTISRTTAIPVTHAARRVKATVQQVGLSRAERATNVQGAFRVDPAGKAAVAGRRVIVVDDVLTSG